MQANRHLGELWFRFVGRHLFAVVFMGATLGGAFAALSSTILPGLPISVPAFAMVGMGAMVGSATGAALTAVAMIFEMTLDYNIVLPMIFCGRGRPRCTTRTVAREYLHHETRAPRRITPTCLWCAARARPWMLIDEATSFEEFVRRPVNPVVWVTWW